MRLIDGDALFDKVYEAFGDDIDGGMANLFMGWINEAPTLTPPNEPLTLDELLKMDGEPVYVVFRPDISGERSQSWALVNVDEKYGEVYLVDSIPGASCYYDEIWADLEGIYRRPPEGEGNA